VPVTRALAIALAMLVAAPALANPPPKADKGHKGSGDDDDDDDDTASKSDAKGSASDTGDDDDDDDDDDAGSGSSKAKAKAPPTPATAPAEEMQKQDLTGHDMGTNKKTTAEEHDRFFVDKVDTDKTKDGTLVQGSLTLSAFFYGESGGSYFIPPGTTATIGNDTTAPSVYWTDLRLQTDFRHIGGGRWDGRVDFRARFVNTPTNDVQGTPAEAPVPGVTTQPNLVQSGLLGQNEYDLRELWLIRNGVSTDLIFGRQFIPDLGAVKIDGLRVDYASSTKFTYLGFAGLYPLRGSRSLSADYTNVVDPNTGQNDGRFTGAAGFGGAYRTQQAYGSVGGVALVPFSGESARVFATATGYWRINPTLDFYHFAIIDVVSSYGSQLTNLTGGLNYKPTQRLRLTFSYNRNDVDTLNIQAAQFFTNNGIGLQNNGAPTPAAPGYVLNEIYVSRIATNEARASISAALGADQRFQLTGAGSYRERPDFTLAPTVAMGLTAGPDIAVKAAQSLEVYGSFTDRHSIADLRLGIDGLDAFPFLGDTPYDRVEVKAVRVFAGRELASGKGEWEAEASYSSATDTNPAGNTCANAAGALDPSACFGASSNTVLSISGTLYYRINSNMFAVLMGTLSHTSITTTTTQPAAGEDAAINGLTGFGRIAYRF
jgi:hypothetical protein